MAVTGPERIVIAGGPLTGKSAMAKHLAMLTGFHLRRTESLLAIDSNWRNISHGVAAWLATSPPWIIEGLAVPRGLRRFMRDDPRKPADHVVWLGIEPRGEVSPGQMALARGIETVWAACIADLVARGVTIDQGPTAGAMLVACHSSKAPAPKP